MEMTDLLHFLFRWGHVVFGITWIGLLYYFNFVQGGYMAAASPNAKVDAFTKLVPSALWWFRWGAMMTFATGVVLLGYIMAGWSVGILVGSLMGILMFLNVWLVIWPNQKIVIASNERVRDGGEADPGQASAAAKALLASRTNTLFSLPMVYFMISHMHGEGAAGGKYLDGWGDLAGAGMWIALAVILAIEANALWGKTGPLTTVKGVIHSSIVLTIALGLVVGLLS